MNDVVCIDLLGIGPIASLFGPLGLKVELIPNDMPIPGSFWGEPEAGLIANVLYVRSDTPVHSALHEGGHFLCMDNARRDGLHTDALSDDSEEAAVCYLQALLADVLEGYSRERLFQDMDAWGYSYRLGSAKAWFEGDAADSKLWLERYAVATSDSAEIARREG